MPRDRFFEAHDVLVRELFDGNIKYQVPILQRRYVWDSEDIRDLLADIKDSKDSTSVDPYYFIGATVFARESASTNEAQPLLVIDGQQRLTTLSLALAVAAQRFKSASIEAGPGQQQMLISQAEHYANMITPNTQDIKTGLLSRTSVLRLHAGDDDFYQRLATSGKPISITTGLSVSQRNLNEAVSTISAFFDENYEDPTTLIEYMSYLANRVVVVRTIAGNPSTAFLIFETINERGTQGLGPEDLLKNQLLRKLEDTSDEAFNRFSGKWESFISKLTRPNGKYAVRPSTFLKHYIMSLGHYITKDDIYDWFKNYDLPVPVMEFMDALVDTAAYYRELHDGKVDGPAADLKTLGFRQSYVILLAVMNLQLPDRLTVARLLETLAIEYVFTGGKTAELERKFSSIARTFKDSPEQLEVRLTRLISDLKALAQERKGLFVTALREYQMSPSAAGRKKVKFLLAKLATALDGSDYSGYEVEHVMPEAADASNYGMDEKSFRLHLNHIGNLALLPKGDNASASAASFATKQGVYRQSACRLTRSLAEVLTTGTKNTQHDKAIAAFNYSPSPNNSWDQAEIERRAEAYVDLALHVLGLHTADATRN